MSFDLKVSRAALGMAEFKKAVSSPLDSPVKIGYAFTCLMRGEESGFACAMMLDKKRRYIGTVCLKRHGEMSEEPLLSRIADALEANNASFFAVAHNHKAGILLPSQADFMTTELIRQRFLCESTVFLDHYIVAGDAWSTILSRNKCKKYRKLKDLL